MLLLFCLLGFVISALGAPAANPESASEPVPILSEEIDVDPSGSYKYSYESGDGTKAEQSGELKTLDKDKQGEVVRGSYEYTDPDGKLVRFTYTADENGFQPESDVIPRAPETPASVARALKFIQEHPSAESATNAPA